SHVSPDMETGKSRFREDAAHKCENVKYLARCRQQGDVFGPHAQ
ncbi:unnamed protein product, partial [marine sediment metagenome]